jgi:superfamily I DNA/RNA helicase
VCELIDDGAKKEIKHAIKILKAVMDDKAVSDDELDKVLGMVGILPRQIAKDILQDEIISTAQRVGNPSIRKLPIKATTIQSSKGLAAEYVFITHFDDQYFIKSKDKKIISDQDICNFLVALTRAKKKVFLISSGKKEPTFLKWIDAGRIDQFGE